MPDALTKFGIGEIFWTKSKNKKIHYTDVCENKMKILKTAGTNLETVFSKKKN